MASGWGSHNPAQARVIAGETLTRVEVIEGTERVSRKAPAGGFSAVRVRAGVLLSRSARVLSFPADTSSKHINWAG